MKKVGLFCGSFNPIHLGHLALANYICEFQNLDMIWFVVSPHNPLKEQEGILEENKRLELVELAVRGYDKFQASDFEFHLPKPSYTIYTLDALKLAYPSFQFYLLIGADNWAVFDQWKEHQRILDENQLLIYPRRGSEVDAASLPEQVHLVETPLLEVSSTFIREAIQKQKDIRYFLHPDVWNKICEQKLYQYD